MKLKQKINFMKTKNKISIFLIIFLSINSAFSQVEKIQAAYLINFARYFEWPANYLPENFVIGVLGNNFIVSELQNNCNQ